jgi:class 3 adenylate cyclase/predicted ATPase
LGVAGRDGALTVQRCPSCDEENPDRFRLCGFCGATLQVAAAPPQEVRKTVTIVFSDLKGSTSLGERLDSETLREVLAQYFAAMREVLVRHGGTVEKYIGDAIMAVFGLPTMHEDDALRAVRAVLDMQVALRDVNVRLRESYGVELENRTGINTGEVVTGDGAGGQRLATGDTVNVAARLEQAAPASEALIGESTYQLVRDLVLVETVEPLELKGKSERVPAYRLLGVTQGEVIGRRVDLPLVGRDGQLHRLVDTFESVASDRTCHLVSLLAAPGIGKSRLIEELVRRVDPRAQVFRGRCLTYGAVTFWPIIQVLQQAAGIVDDDDERGVREKLAALDPAGRPEVAERLAAVLGLTDATYSKEELLWAIGTTLGSVAAGAPLIVVFDDVHWGEPTFLEAVEHIHEATVDAPILIVCAARPELLDEHPQWGQPGERSGRIELDELSPSESAQVLQNALRGGHLPAALTERILTVANGNPLFIEQMLSSLQDRGLLRTDGEGLVFVGKADTIEVPASVASLLAARLDALGQTPRSVAERAAVIGLDFEVPALEALSDETTWPQLPSSLRLLCQRRLLRQATAEQYQFSNVVVRDAAYERLLKRSRAGLHEKFADWLTQHAGSRLAEYEEIVGYHLEQASLYHRELGGNQEQIAPLGLRASGHLAAAGHRAFARGDMPAAGNLLRRAALLLDEAAPDRAGLLLAAGEALMEAGDLPTAGQDLAEAIDTAMRIGDEATARSARLSRLYLRYVTAGEDEGTSDEAVTAGLAELEAAGDYRALARAWRLLSYIRGTASHIGAAAEAVERTIHYAKAAGDEVMARRFLGALANCSLYGPTPVPEAIAQCHMVIEQAAEDHKATALAEQTLGHLEAMRGEFESARERCRRSRETLVEHGWKLFAALTSLESALVEVLAGDLVAAEAELRADYQALDEMGESNYISTIAAFLGDVLYRQGRYDEAIGYALTCVELAAADDVASQFLWRCLLGKLLARRKSAEALRVSREAIALLEDSDQLDWQGNGFLDLAEVHWLLGDSAAAALAADAAHALFMQKGNLISARRALAMADDLRHPILLDQAQPAPAAGGSL